MRKARGQEQNLAPDGYESKDSPSFAVEEKWAYSSAFILRTVCIAETGYVVASDGARVLSCISQTGEMVFRRQFNDRIASFSLSRDGANVVVILRDWTVILLDISGETIWETRLPGAGSACAMRVSDGTIFVGSSSGTVWLINRGGNVFDLLEFPAAVEFITFDHDEKAALVGNFGAFFGLLGDQNEVLWVKSLSTSCGRARFSRCGRHIILPAYGQGALLFDRDGRDGRSFRVQRPVAFGACLGGGASGGSVLLGTIDGKLLLLTQDGAVLGQYDLPCRPTHWDTDASCSSLAVSDETGSVLQYELVAGASTRFDFLEHGDGTMGQVEKSPVYSVRLCRRASSSFQAQMKVLPGGKYMVCASSDGRVWMYDERGKELRVASLGAPVFDLCVASRSYCFAAATEGYLHLFGHDRLLWRKRIGTAMLAVNGAGNRVATMDLAGNVYVFDSDGELLRTVRESGDARYFLISPSGEDVVLAEKSRAILFDFRGRQVFSVEAMAGRDRLAMDDERLYVGLADGTVRALDMIGRQLWSAPIGEPVARIRPFEDGVFVTSTAKSAFFIGAEGEIRWRESLTSGRSIVSRNQRREFVEVLRVKKSLVCIALGGEMLWKVLLQGTGRNVSVDSSGEFIGAFDGISVWLFPVSDFTPREPGRFDYLEI